MCGDSNTANPGTPGTPPELKPDTGDDNGGDGPGTTTPPAVKISTIQLTSPVTGYSKEGQKPNLDGLKVRVIYEDGKAEVLTVEGNDLFGTSPALVGQAQIASPGNIDVAAPTWISVFPREDQSRAIDVEIPGVQALVVSSGSTQIRGDVKSITHPISTATAIGFAVPANFTLKDKDAKDLSYTGITIYQDEFNFPPEVKGGSIGVKYEDLWETEGQKTAGKRDDGLISGTASGSFDYITLGPEHIFYDYYDDFLSGAYDADDRPYLPYGIDLKNKEVAFLISRGLAGTHGGASNQSIYVVVPFSATTFYYVRDIKVTGYNFTDFTSDADGKKYSDFAIQSDLIALDTAAKWSGMLNTAKMAFTVFYDNNVGDGNQVSNTTKNRDVTYYKKALDNKVAGVMNFRNENIRIPTPVVSVSDDDNFGLVAVGYYTSLVVDPRDPIGKGDFPNMDVVDLPIAVYQDGSAEMKLKKNAVHPDLDNDGMLKLVVAPAGTAPATGARITDKQFDAIRNTYDLVGTFIYEPKPGTVQKGERTPVTKKLTDLNAAWFTALNTTEVDLNYEVTVSVRSLQGGLGNLFNGQEAVFYVKLYPQNYDSGVNP